MNFNIDKPKFTLPKGQILVVLSIFLIIVMGDLIWDNYIKTPNSKKESKK